MKTIKFFFAAAVFWGLWACSSSAEDNIVGTWDATSIKYNNVEWLNSDPTTTNVTGTFNANGTGYSSSDAGGEAFTYVIDGDSLRTYFSDTISYYIQSLSASEMKLRFTPGTIIVDYTFEKQ